MSKKSKLIVWSSISGFSVVLLTVATILATGKFYSLLNTVMPGAGERPRFAEGTESYYLSDYKTKSDVYNAAEEFNVKLGDEGFTLLKNKNNALPIKTNKSTDTPASTAPKISVFGKNSVNLAYGGSGSSGVSSTARVDLYKALEKSGFDVNPTLKAFYEDTKASGEVRSTSGSDLDSGDTVVLSTAETPQSSYTETVKSSYANYKDAAIVVLTRVGGEGMDIPRMMKGATSYRNEDDHFLQLDANEEDMLAAVCQAGFNKVIVVVNACNAMELGFLKEGNPYVTQKGYKIDPSKIDSAIWMGYPGDTATYALGEILNGNVNPSGHTVDTYVTDLKKDPTWNNFGDCNRTSNSSQNGGDQYTLNGQSKMYYFVDYEEGVYDGYRYYETRGAQEGDTWYDNNVVYPFGYGLSYTTFKWELEDDSAIKNVAIEQGKTYDVKVKVTNTGSVAGKDVVQLYGHAPYTANEIEKSEESLLAFAKTKELKPNESETLTLTIDPYYLASYDYRDQNKNGFKGYELEAGSDYKLYVSRNAHDKEFTIPFKVNEGFEYEKSTVDENVTVENLYTDCEDSAFDSDTQLSTILSRNNWDGTWPTTPNESDWAQSKTFFDSLDDDSDNNPHTSEYEDMDMPKTEENNGLKLRDLLFNEDGSIHDTNNDGIPEVDYDDPRWEKLLDQLKVSEGINMYDTAAYCTAAVESLGMPYTLEGDGPVGFTCFMNQTDFKNNCNYAAEMVVASTWNVELTEEYGEMIGQEGILGSESRGLPYTGIYAPGANIHRSAFGGRNAEYMSEDPFLTGKMAASEIKGMQNKGVIPFIKHFALNEQETHRSISGDCSWVTEQAMREIYLKGFEIAIKESKCLGVMSSFNRIGTRWTGGDYRLMTTILRDEWGFRGCTISDFNTIPKYMVSRQMAYAGGDLNLTTSATSVSWCDDTSAADVIVLRQNVKNVAYALVNSNAMNSEIIGYDLPYWVFGLIAIDALAFIAIAITGFFTIKNYVKKD